MFSASKLSFKIDAASFFSVLYKIRNIAFSMILAIQNPLQYL
jgi:hypothetical protein